MWESIKILVISRKNVYFLFVICKSLSEDKKLSAPAGCPSFTLVGVGVGVLGIRSGEIAWMEFRSTCKSPNLFSTAAFIKIVKTFSSSTF